MPTSRAGYSCRESSIAPIHRSTVPEGSDRKVHNRDKLRIQKPNYGVKAIEIVRILPQKTGSFDQWISEWSKERTREEERFDGMGWDGCDVMTMGLQHGRITEEPSRGDEAIGQSGPGDARLTG
jgi:hypothetical protein